MKSCFLSTARVGLKGPTGTFFSIILEKSFFFPKKICIFWLKKKCHKKKKISDGHVVISLSTSGGIIGFISININLRLNDIIPVDTSLWWF